jgi:glycosyltransferase involved in cell wall biosynthesis
MPKLLYVLTRFNVGGVSVQVALASRCLSAQGYKVSLVAGSCDRHEGDMRYLLQPGDDFTYVPEMSRPISPWKDSKALWRLYRIIRRERPDILHTHTAKAGALGRVAARLAGVPIVVHTFHGNSLSKNFSAPANFVFRTAERVFARFTDAICVLCSQQVTELSDSFHIASRRKFRVIPCGLELEPYLALPAPAPPDPCLTVGWLGRFAPVKNVPLLAAIVDETLRRSPHIRFLVAGDGSDRHHIEQAAARSGGRLEWLGWQTDVTPILARCHLLIQTAHNEGTPVTLIQGMAARRPFISTPAGGVVDMVTGPVWKETTRTKWYANGVLADPDPAAFADAILELAAHPEQLAQMGASARNLAVTQYRQDRLVNDLDRLYTELLAALPAARGIVHKAAQTAQIRTIQPGLETDGTNPISR